MKITNKYNLPQPIVDAVTKYSTREVDWDISVSELIKPPYMRMLELKHADEITQDASERIWALMGSVGHKVLEGSDTNNHFSEERLSVEIDGYTLSGQTDLYGNETVDDYKFTSTWAVKEDKDEWVKQLNTYRWLFEKHGFPVKKMRIVAILRDWRKNERLKYKDYPPVQVVVKEIPKDPDIEAWIKERVRLHQEAMKGNYQPCTPEERWRKPDTWAVKKKGGKRAMRVFENELEAKLWDPPNPNTAIEIERRPGKDVRCADYCAVREFCEYKVE